MNDIASYVVANTYSAFSPLASAAATCKVNGQIVACPEWLNNLGPAFIGPAFMSIFAILSVIIAFIVAVILVVSIWKVFKKAGKPGWAAIIPIYNLIVMLEIARKPTWWVFGIFLPFVNMVVAIMVTYEFAKAFGKDVGFAVGLMVLPFVFYPILAFGMSAYIYSESSVSTPPPVA